jgi:hypothetical protein
MCFWFSEEIRPLRDFAQTVGDFSQYWIENQASFTFRITVLRFPMRPLRLCGKPRFYNFVGSFPQRRKGAKVAKKECASETVIYF